jgi:transposase
MKNYSSEYSGEVFVGIDVHRSSYMVAEVISGEVVKKTSMPSSWQTLLKYLSTRYPNGKIKSVYEAGFSGFVLHRKLMESGIENIVVNASSIAVEVKDKVKTDRRDSVKLALHLSKGLLKGIRVPAESEEQQRLYHRTRAQLVKDRTRIILRVRMRLLQFDLLPNQYYQILTLKYTKALIVADDFPIVVSNSLKPLLALWELIEDEIKKLNKQFRIQSTICPIVQKYLTIPGIGIQTATVFATELGDMSQFNNEKALFNFVGLTPCEFSSGNKIRKGHITRQGNSTIRKLLTEAAWVAIRKDPALRMAYTRIAVGKNGKKAIVAIARKLIGRARSLFKKGCDYELNYNQIELTKKAA